MSELLSIGTLRRLAVWGSGCHCAGTSHDSSVAAPALQARSCAKISVALAFLIFTAAICGCIGQAQTVPAPLKTGPQQNKPGVVRQGLHALRSLYFEPTVDGEGMVSRSERRSLQLDPGGAVEIYSLVSGKPAEVDLRLDGSNSASAVTGSQALPSHSNYFFGNDPAKWRTRVTHFEQARVNGVYPGIDLLYYGNGESLEHDYQLSPGSDPALIRMRISGSVSRIDAASGDLIVSQAVPATELLRLHKPVAYQANADESRDLVAAAYRQNDDGSFSFSLGDYDPSRALVIDPVITYSTYFGGTSDDAVNDVKLDATGNMYLLLQTSSIDMPAISQIAGACNGECGQKNPSTTPGSGPYDYFVAKLDPTGQTLLFSTYLGGSKNDNPGALAVGTDGKIYVSGQTFSPDFPLVNERSNKLAPLGYYGEQTTTSTLTVLSSDGSKILYSTFVGGGFTLTLSYGGFIGYGYDGSNGLASAPSSLAVAPDGIVYLLGYATTTTPGDGVGRPFYDATGSDFTAGEGSFIAKFDTTKAGPASLIYARPFGSPGDEAGEMFSGIALDSKQNLWVLGSVGPSAPAPTPDAVQPVCGAGGSSQCLNAFLFELNPAGVITYATYLGGTTTQYGGVPTEHPEMIYIDSADNIYVNGQTESTDFPTMNAAYTYATVFSRGGGFLTKLSPGGKSILYSTYLPERNSLIAAAPDGMAAAVFVEGGGMPVVNGLPPYSGLYYGDAYIMMLDTTKAGTSSVASLGYLGSSGDLADAVTFDAQQNLVLAGNVFGSLPVVNPFQSTCAGTCQRGILNDGFLSRIQYQAGKLTLTPATESFANTSVGSTSPPLTATLTNGTAQPITLSSPSLTDSTDFTATDNCNGSIATAASCTITFTFNPSAAGTLSSSYSIADASQPDSHVTVQLSGAGVGPATLNPASHDFGNVTVGAYAQYAFTWTNTGSNPTTPGEPTTTGAAFSAPYPSNCGSPVNPSAACTIQVLFSPTVDGTVTGSVQLHINGITYTSTLTGTGGAAVYAATLTPATLDFGSINVGLNAPAAQFLYLKNTGNVPLKNLKFKLSDSISFTLDEATGCFNPEPLAPGASCSFNVHFSAVKPGKVTASLTVQSDAGTQVATLTGTGIGPSATLTPALNLGNVTVGSVGTGTLTFTNTGPEPITLTLPSITGSGFILGSGTCEQGSQSPVYPGASCTFRVNFSPSAAGAVTGSFTLNDDAGTQVATLTGTGVAAVHAATLTPATLDFGSSNVGVPAPSQILVLKNTGNVPINNAKYQVSDSVDFPVDGSSGCNSPAPLAPGASCSFNVHFSAAEPGKVTASLTVQSDAGTQVVTLTGTGVPEIPPDFTLATTGNSITLFRGSTGTVTLQLGSSAVSSPLTSPVTFSASGLPAGVTSTFAPASVTLGTGGSSTVMTIFVPALSAIDSNSPPGGRGTAFSISAAALIAGLFGLRRKLNLRLSLCLCALSLLGVITGCGTEDGVTIPASISNVVVTATSGAISHSVTVTLTVK